MLGTKFLGSTSKRRMNALMQIFDSSATIAQPTGQENDVETIASTSDTNSASVVPSYKHIIPADAITVNKQLGAGEFGIVQQGVWTNGNDRIQVAIKCLCRERMQSNPMEFLKEAVIMHSIEHENIVRLYGVVLPTDSLMLVTELAHLRSLLECLKELGLRESFLTIPTLCEFAMQICNGMRYLENKRLIHRDLAARNILVFSKNKVKISDFGLSRALGVGKDYYKTNFNVNLKLPIAWCAPECINYLRFTNSSDVWAYGVCLWEMFSYGFQPWAALTGLQILEAIDAPNYQRLEQPDCCPREYYTLMMKCWQDDPAKRPKFADIYEMLPDMKPEQLKTVVHCLEPKKDHLLYNQGDIITVLDRNTGTPFWKGVLVSGKTGLFNPSNTVTFLEGLPSSNRLIKDSFCRSSDRFSKRKLRTEMISKPQNDFKHVGHVGIDGASFGDIAFLSNAQSHNHVPRQIVTPYKPSEDIEQTPLLLPPTPTSPDSLQTASGYFPKGANTTSVNQSFIHSTENTPKHFSMTGQSSFEFPGQQSSNTLPGVSSFTNPFTRKTDDATLALQNENYGIESKSFTNTHPSILAEAGTLNPESHWGGAAAAVARNNADELHEYHEISDDELTADKLDSGPSLLDEINSMLSSISASISHPKSPDVDQANMKNEFTEFTSKSVRKNSAGDSNHSSMFTLSTSKKKSTGIVKQISVKDEKILNQAIEIANEFSARSMNDLVPDQPCNTQSPKRKFSFRFPHLTSNGANEKPMVNNCSSSSGSSNNSQQKYASPHSKKKNFTEELQSIPDIQTIIGEEGREAYNSLIERKTPVGLSPAANLFMNLDTNEFEIATAKTLPRHSKHFRNEQETLVSNLETYKKNEKTERLVSLPLKNNQQRMTLPTRSAAGRVRRIELNESNKPKEFGGGEILEQNECNRKSLACDGTATSPCESPSYISNTFYKFPDKQSKVPVSTADTNPIPLPSREGKKHIAANPKRHVRKHPLIIPGNGVQRTLNKVTGESSTYDEASNDSLLGKENDKSNSLRQKTFEVVASIRGNPRLSQQHYENACSQNESHTYQNIGKNTSSETSCDSASLHFESILEADFNKGNVLQSPDVTDGFYNFSIQKEQYNKSKEVDFDPNHVSGLYVNEDELRNLDVEKSLKAHHASNNTISSISTPMATNSTSTTEINTASKEDPCSVESKDHPQCEEFVSMRDKSKSIASSQNELTANALFQKVRESVDSAMFSKSSQLTQKSQSPKQQTEAEYFAEKAARLADSNSVSCEDLLEFADKKPKGCERGVDSDEVRIMMKVLGKDNVAPTRCLSVLDFIDWDVHKAIKIIKLQNILPSANLNLFESVEALQQHEWDLHFTALKLKSQKT